MTIEATAQIGEGFLYNFYCLLISASRADTGAGSHDVAEVHNICVISKGVDPSAIAL